MAALGVMTNVTPQQAQSNLSSWFDNPPQWMVPPKIDDWFGPAFYWLSVGFFAWAILPWAVEFVKQRRLLNKQDPRRDKLRAGLGAQEKFIPLPEAATTAYTKPRQTMEARFLDGFGETPENKLVHYASALASKIPVFGRCLPSMEHDEIWKGEFENGKFGARGAEFRRQNDKEARWADLRVRESDLLRAIDEMKKGEESEHSDRWTWPALTKTEINNLYAALKDKKGQHSVHIACDNAQCGKLADSLAVLFSRLMWPHFIRSGMFDAQGASGLLLTPDNETARILKTAIEINTDLEIEILRNTRDSGSTAGTMLIIGSRD